MGDGHPLPGADLVVDGVRLHVVTHGDGQGLPVLLVHGLPGSCADWAAVMVDLGRGSRTVAPDLAGLGRSERPARRCDPAAQARLLAGLLDRVGLDRVVVAGADVGGAVAVHLAALAPERVAGLALLGTQLSADVWPPVGLLLRSAAHRDLARVARAVDLAAAASAWRIVCAAAPPTLLLWGEEDRVCSAAYGRRLAADAPGAAWVPVAGAGHDLHRDRPERVAEELAGFAAEASGAARVHAVSR